MGTGNRIFNPVTQAFRDGTHATYFGTFLVVGPLFVLAPVFYCVFLWSKYKVKTGEVRDNPATLKEGEELGEELSLLDTTHYQRTYGFFYKSYERRYIARIFCYRRRRTPSGFSSSRPCHTSWPAARQHRVAECRTATAAWSRSQAGLVSTVLHV